MGADGFVVLLDGGSDHGSPDLVAERLLEVMRQPFVIEESPVPMVITTSVGLAIGDRANAGDLLRDAHVALYLAKAAGKNCHEVFRPETDTDTDTDIANRYRLAFDLL